MARFAVVSGVILCLLPQAAMAGQASASFQVGIRIGKAEGRAVPLTAPVKSYTWGAAAISVTEAGFEPTQRMEKSAGLYWFEAKRGLANFRIAVSIRSGEVVKIVR